MAEITVKLVKELREKSGAGVMDAKKALVETDGDIEKAIELLREKGMAKAAKKRIAFSWLMSPQCAKLAISSGWWGARLFLRAQIRAWFALVQSFGSVWAATSSTNSSRRLDCHKFCGRQ